MATVTNPLKADFDAATYSIQRVGALDAETIQSRTGVGIGPGGNAVFNDGAGNLLCLTSCAGDPSVDGLTKPLGSVCLSLGGLYRKTGVADTDWTRLG
jgi:hypothetical protein